MTTEIESAIAASAYRWRLKLTNESGGAFENMVAVLMVPDEKFESFERLIVAGNGCVVQPRFDNKYHFIIICFITIILTVF